MQQYYNNIIKYFRLYIDSLITLYEVENGLKIKNKEELILNIVANYKEYIQDDLFTYLRQNAIVDIYDFKKV